MWFWVAVLLGIVQGITEFLPISSSGHLVLCEKLFGIEFDATFLNVLLHVSTLFAVCWYYRKKILYLITHPFCKMNLMLVVATLPAVIFVLLASIWFDLDNTNFIFLGVGFLLTAFFLLCAEFATRKNKNPKPLGWGGAIIMGIAQAMAVFPGLSRSGTTFAFGTVSGIEKNVALDFSFLMSIPIILASLIYEIFFTDKQLSFANTDWISVVIACVCAFIFAILGLKLMNKLVKKIQFWWFIPYLVILGIILLVL